MDNDFYDFIIIGAGLAGLASAALLAKDGYRVKVLEAHTVSGGCASYFKRKNFTFDVGATTLSGLGEGQPLKILLEKLNINLESLKFQKKNLAMRIFQDGTEINRYANFDLWIDELSKHFCNSAEERNNMKLFWEKLYKIESDSWKLLESNSNLLPATVADYLSFLKPKRILKNLNAIKYIPSLFRSLKKLLVEYKLEQNSKFIEFLDEQLIISTQSYVDKSPELMSALGLTYASELYYPYGGIHKLSLALENALENYGAEIQFKSEVTEIETIKMNREKIFFIKDKQDREYLSNYVISNIPLWNMVNLCSGKTRDFFKSYANKFEYNTSAFALYFAVETEEDFDELNYFQIICPELIPNCSAKSFFVTLSPKDDHEKAIPGWRSVTISTHTDANFWLNLDSETYKKKKNETQNYIFDQLFANIPSLREAEKEFISSSSSKSFEFFTRRKSGLVGGIPHSTDYNILDLMPKKVPGEKLFMVGDTVFPGQGLVATAYSALSLRETLKLNGVD